MNNLSMDKIRGLHQRADGFLQALNEVHLSYAEMVEVFKLSAKKERESAIGMKQSEGKDIVLKFAELLEEKAAFIKSCAAENKGIWRI